MRARRAGVRRVIRRRGGCLTTGWQRGPTDLPGAVESGRWFATSGGSDSAKPGSPTVRRAAGLTSCRYCGAHVEFRTPCGWRQGHRESAMPLTSRHSPTQSTGVGEPTPIPGTGRRKPRSGSVGSSLPAVSRRFRRRCRRQGPEPLPRPGRRTPRGRIARVGRPARRSTGCAPPPRTVC